MTNYPIIQPKTMQFIYRTYRIGVKQLIQSVFSGFMLFLQIEINKCKHAIYDLVGKLSVSLKRINVHVNSISKHVPVAYCRKAKMDAIHGKRY